ncbi:hypothetical protein BLNAU_24097 [Blattamonas nauphoetae]|uniref:Uncharacterized protein n=1 Tax=Blattamonas nauphoetae TaxID=2049346 RepID=A0ABQ9WNS0_9EUKA|nr:hypothetical protein BLNAU_24097 [Blattamonas nauphoetae]
MHPRSGKFAHRTTLQSKRLCLTPFGALSNPKPKSNHKFIFPTTIVTPKQNPQTTSHPYIPAQCIIPLLPQRHKLQIPLSNNHCHHNKTTFNSNKTPTFHHSRTTFNHSKTTYRHSKTTFHHNRTTFNHNQILVSIRLLPRRNHKQFFHNSPNRHKSVQILKCQRLNISHHKHHKSPNCRSMNKSKGYICAYSNQRITTPVTLEGYPNEFYERDVITKYIRRTESILSSKKIDFSPFQTTTINPVTAPFPTWEHVFDHNNLTVNELLKGAKRQNIRKEIKDNAPFDFIPHFHGVVRLDQPLTWSDRCHRSNTATITVDQDSGFILNLTAADPEAWYCADHHAYTTSETQLFDTVFKAGTHLIKHKKWASPEEYQYVLQHGVNMFSFDSNVWTLLKNGLFLRKLLTKTYSMKEKDLLKFTTEQLGVELVQRSETLYHSGVISEIKTGDIFALHRLDGENQLRWYFTNSPITHVAIAVREQKEDGTDELFVYETSSIEFTSTVVPPWGVGFRKTPFMTWLAEFQSKGYSVAWLPIKQSLSDDFDVASATTWYDQHVNPSK